MTLTTAQVRALRVLSANQGHAETTRKTHGRWISGRCADSLERMGLVTIDGWLPRHVHLTSRGRHIIWLGFKL